MSELPTSGTTGPNGRQFVRMPWFPVGVITMWRCFTTEAIQKNLFEKVLGGNSMKVRLTGSLECTGLLVCLLWCCSELENWTQSVAPPWAERQLSTTGMGGEAVMDAWMECQSPIKQPNSGSSASALPKSTGCEKDDVSKYVASEASGGAVTRGHGVKPSGLAKNAAWRGRLHKCPWFWLSCLEECKGWVKLEAKTFRTT